MAEAAHIDNEESLYKILGVSSDASPGEIRAAYRHLAKQSRMIEINEAYSILGDPARRAAYDAGLGLEKERYEEYVESVSYAESFAQQVRCQGCGRFDHTLRVVAFPYVISILIMSFKRSEAGIFCHYCRSAKSTKCTAISLLFGWWGFPFGIFWTLESLMVNLLRGKTPKEENQQLLKQLAWVNAALGRIDEAKAALRDLLKYGTNEEAKKFKDELDGSYPSVQPARVSGFSFGYLITVVAILAMYIFIGNTIFGEPNGTNGTMTPPAQVVPVTPSKPVSENSPKTTSLIPPSDSFVVWQDSSDWVSYSTAGISGSVVNTHADWSISNVRVELELVDEHDTIIRKVSVSVLPSTIAPMGRGEYYKTVEVPSSCDAFSPVLHWQWIPPQ